MNSAKNIVVVGAGGQLGKSFRQVLGEGAVYLSSADLDVRKEDAVNAALARYEPDIVLNCSGYTAVDQAESEQNLAFALNAQAPGMLAQACSSHGARLVHFSTDYVFDGVSGQPYREDSPVQPLGVYGQSKREGEVRVLEAGQHLVFRVSWLYSPFGKNFFKTMLKLASERDFLEVVNDQVSAPTYAADLVNAVLRVLNRADASGIIHFANSGLASWYDFACEIVRPVYPDIPVRPVQTGHFKTAASRPAYSRLSTDRYTGLTGYQPRNWKDALRECRENYTLETEKR